MSEQRGAATVSKGFAEVMKSLGKLKITDYPTVAAARAACELIQAVKRWEERQATNQKGGE